MPKKSEAERKAAVRARKAAGYKFLSGYTDAATAPEIEGKLISAEAVDRKLVEKEEKKIDTKRSKV